LQDLVGNCDQQCFTCACCKRLAQCPVILADIKAMNLRREIRQGLGASRLQALKEFHYKTLHALPLWPATICNSHRWPGQTMMC